MDIRWYKMRDGTKIDVGYYLNELNKHLATGKEMRLPLLQGLRELLEDMCQSVGPGAKPLIKPAIRNKIRNVSDKVCLGCTQLWQNECRAFCMPRSEAERQARLQDGPPLQGLLVLACENREAKNEVR